MGGVAMLALLLAWAQQQAGSGFVLTSDEVRTAMIGAIGAICAYIAKQATAALKELREVKTDIRDLKRDVHGVDGTNGIKSDVKLLVKRVDAIEDRNIAIDAVVEAERQQWPHRDRRAGARRLRDVIHEAHDERQRAMTDEHPIEEDIP